MIGESQSAYPNASTGAYVDVGILIALAVALSRRGEL